MWTDSIIQGLEPLDNCWWDKVQQRLSSVTCRVWGLRPAGKSLSSDNATWHRGQLKGGHFFRAGWYNLPCAFGGGRRWEGDAVLQQSHPHLPSSHVVSFLAPDSSKGLGEAVPLMALSLLQLLIMAPAVPRFIPKARAGAGMFIYYSPKWL